MRPLTSLPALILDERLLHRKALLVFVPPPTMSLNRVELQTASPVTHVSHSPHELPAQGLVVVARCTCQCEFLSPRL